MEATVYDKLRNNVDTVIIPATNEMLRFVEGEAPRTPAHGAIHSLNCGFLAGVEYAMAVCEKGEAINTQEQMRSFLCDVLELALNTKGW